MDTEIFILLKRQVMDVFIFSLAIRRFAAENGMQNEVARINNDLAENVDILSLVNKQLKELNATPASNRIGFFESARNVA